MDGDAGLIKYVDKVLSERGHCVLCLAEGAGQVWLFLLRLHVHFSMSTAAAVVSVGYST